MTDTYITIVLYNIWFSVLKLLMPVMLNHLVLVIQLYNYNPITLLIQYRSNGIDMDIITVLPDHRVPAVAVIPWR